MIRIALNVSALHGPKTGIGRYVDVLRQGFSDETSCVNPEFFWGDRWGPDNGPSTGLTPERARLRRRIASMLPLAHELNRYRQQHHFSKVCQSVELYHEPNFLPFTFSGPTVITVHDLSVLRYPEMHPRARVRMFNRFFEKGLNDASHIITVSESVRQETLETFGFSRDRVTCVHNGVNRSFSPSQRSAVHVLRSYGLEAGRYWIALGTLEPRKNLELVLEAFRALPEKDRKVGGPLVVVGMQGWKEGSLLARIRPFIQAGELRLLGYVPEADLPALLASARALLYPSRYEGFGLPPLEAMACGTPVIASTAASVAEVVSDAGLLVDPDDIDACAQGMMRMLHDESFSLDLAVRGLQRSQYFSWDRCVTETVDVYRNVLGHV